jgi:hypothetical protein
MSWAKDEQAMTVGESLQQLAGAIRRTCHEISF